MTKGIHAPLHLFNEAGTYMITGSTLNKEHHFKTTNDLDNLQNSLFELSQKYQWKLEAWTIFSNHYHFIAHSPEDPKTLKKMITHLHASSARQKIGNMVCKSCSISFLLTLQKRSIFLVASNPILL